MSEKINYLNFWTPEGVYAQWIGVSLLLTASSLLFYHMTRVKSLEMNPKLSGIFAISLILSAVIIGIVSMIPYYKRIQHNLNILENTKLNKESENAIKNENSYRISYIAITIAMIIIELGISYVIITGSFKH